MSGPAERVAIEGLRVVFPERATPALAGLDLVWEPGEALAVVGGSGAGKSTLLRVLLGAVRPEAGVVRWRGGPLFGPRGPDRRLLAGWRAFAQPLFQHPGASLDPRATLGESVEEGPIVRGGIGAAERRRIVEASFAAVDLDPALGDRFPHEVSGGQRQRAALARALAVSPRALLLDEPTSALDAVSQLGFVDLLARLRAERGLGLLLVSHDLGLVRRVADRVAVLENGHLVECAPAADLYADPRHPYTKALLRAARHSVRGATGAESREEEPSP
ncbi:MAG: ATP-binding cassette domain-containing protein [Planctomycetota bacterium]